MARCAREPAKPRVVYAGARLELAEWLGDESAVWLALSLHAPESLIGPPRLIVGSGALQLARRPELQASLLAQAFGKLAELEA